MAGLAGTSPVFDELLDSDQPRDTEVIIVEEGSSTAADTSTGQEAGRKRSRQDTPESSITLAAHWVVLYSLSPYFKTKIERWSREDHASKRQQQQQQEEGQLQQQEAPPAYQYSLQLLVPPGQLELGRRLITAMYSSSPDLSDLTAPQLMQLAALAECYGVGRVVAAVGAHLQQLTVKTMPLDTAAAVFELPEACLTLPPSKLVLQTAADKLQQELGDLEVVWGDEAKQAALLGLPFGALLQLLKDERTRVAGEDTAVYTAAQWLAEHPEAATKAPQLLDFLRLPHCTPTYLSSPITRQHLHAWGVSVDDTHQLCALCALAEQQQTEWLDSVDVESEGPAAWLLPRRPASALMRLRCDWELPLSEVRGLFEDAQRSSSIQRMWMNPITWQGRRWECGVYVEEQGGFGLCVQCPDQGACFHNDLRMLASPGSSGFKFDNSMTCAIKRSIHYPYQVITNPIPWAQLQQQLEEYQLVHPGGKLRLKYSISQVS